MTEFLAWLAHLPVRFVNALIDFSIWLIFLPVRFINALLIVSSNSTKDYKKELDLDDHWEKRHFDVSFSCDAHAVFVLMVVNAGILMVVNAGILMVVNAGIVYSEQSLWMQFGHDLRSDALSRNIKDGYIRITLDRNLEITAKGREKINNMLDAGRIAKGKKSA